VLLPWVVAPNGNLLGISQPDGRLTLLLGVASLILVWYRVRVAWLVAGFLTVFLVRNIWFLGRMDEADPGWGLWLSAVAFCLAAGVEVQQLARSTLGRDS
jgi:hypothetical protein